jgi:hypothetical protein
MKNKNSNGTSKSLTRMVLVILGSGALTFVIAGLATFAGYMIDRRAGTDLRWTLIMLIGSMPISLGGAYLISRGAVRKMKAERAALEQQAEEEKVGEEPEDEG